MDQSISAHSDVHRDVQKACTASRSAGRRTPRPVQESADQSRRHRLAGVESRTWRAPKRSRGPSIQTAWRGPDELQLRGTHAGGPCVIVRRGQRTRFTGLAFRACDEVDALRLADKSGVTRDRCRRRPLAAISRPGRSQRDPGARGRRNARTARVAGPGAPHFQFRHDLRRTNTTQRPRRTCAGTAPGPPGAAIMTGISRR